MESLPPLTCACHSPVPSYALWLYRGWGSAPGGFVPTVCYMSCNGSYISVHIMSTKTSRLVPWFIPSTTTSLLCLWETDAPQRLGSLEGSCDMSDSWLSLPKPSCHVWFMIKSTKTFMSWKVYSLFQVCVCVCSAHRLLENLMGILCALLAELVSSEHISFEPGVFCSPMAWHIPSEYWLGTFHPGD